MSFSDPLGFNEVADFLNVHVANFSSQGVFRTIISRLYYSSFHSIREKIYGNSGRAVSHRDLQNKAGVAAKNRGREKFITHYLSTFESMRERADYSVSPAVGKDQVIEAYEMFSLVESEFHQIWD
jgi:uncharacterized protein (UPF0332 family)